VRLSGTIFFDQHLENKPTTFQNDKQLALRCSAWNWYSDIFLYII